jgi:hypothetical protein
MCVYFLKNYETSKIKKKIKKSILKKYSKTKKQKITLRTKNS